MLKYFEIVSDLTEALGGETQPGSTTTSEPGCSTGHIRPLEGRSERSSDSTHADGGGPTAVPPA
ncbi:hypothetical protein [Streptomyces cyaneofuscatus]|uniref:hypothetical protein n=1 Tax=Streptomyces cyaneofuscatus TaxID=66883 RepID=UPI00365D5339